MREALRRLRFQLGALRLTTWSFPTAVWMMHLACALQDEEAYEESCRAMEALGGPSETMLTLTPFYFALEEDYFWVEPMQGSSVDLGALRETRDIIRNSVSESEPDIVGVLLQLLTNDELDFQHVGEAIIAKLVRQFY